MYITNTRLPAIMENQDHLERNSNFVRLGICKRLGLRKVYPLSPRKARMENWNQDLPERYSKFRGLYMKFQGHGKWPWTW